MRGVRCMRTLWLPMGSDSNHPSGNEIRVVASMRPFVVQ